MATRIFIKLPVKDLDRSIAFFRQLGYTFNTQNPDQKMSCIIISDYIVIMLFEEEFFKTCITQEIADTSKSIESIICLSADSREKVDELINKAIAAGGQIYKETVEEGFIYQRGYQDLDGHVWEVVYMDMDALHLQRYIHAYTINRNN